MDYLRPGRKRLNIIYHATSQQWTNDEHGPSQAKWREYADSAAMRHPGNLSQADELFLMMVRLRLNLKEQDVANRF